LKNIGINGDRLSILFELGRGPTAVDIINLGGPALTTFGRENIEMIIGFVDLQISTPEADGKTPAENMRIEWMREAHEVSQGFSLFAGGPASYYVKHPRSFFFRDAKAALSDCFELVRSVENVVREESGLPRVGEGWISETKLYREVVEAFQGEEVIHHASPDWLGRQHLDIYLPSLSVAVEYQGAQHDQPVDFFGGEEGFRAIQERDRRKLNICRRHGVPIVFVREGYDLAAVIQQILAASR
jgi:hypothetical protein